MKLSSVLLKGFSKGSKLSLDSRNAFPLCTKRTRNSLSFPPQSKGTKGQGTLGVQRELAPLGKASFLSLSWFFVCLCLSCNAVEAVEKGGLASKVTNHSFPSSYPLISGSVFRDLCHHKLDEKRLEPEEVEEGDLIFLRGENVADFFSRCIDRIQHKFILVSHLTTWTTPEEYEKYLDTPNLVAWFAKNAKGSHPKLHQIPIGLFQEWVLIDSQSWNAFEVFRSHLQRKYFSSETLPFLEESRPYLLTKAYTMRYNTKDRIPLNQYFGRQSFCTSFPFMPYRKYCDILKKSTFVLSPPGKGVDCHRTWEAMLIGAYPIIKSSFLDPLYEHMPVVIVKNWEEVTQPFLEQKKAELSHKPIPLEQWYADFWLQKILDVRKKEIPNAVKPLFLTTKNPYIDLQILPFRKMDTPLLFAKANEWVKLKQCMNIVVEDPSLVFLLAKALPSYGHVILLKNMKPSERSQFLSNVLYAHAAQKVILLDEEEWRNSPAFHSFEKASVETILSDLQRFKEENA